MSEALVPIRRLGRLSIGDWFRDPRSGNVGQVVRFAERGYRYRGWPNVTVRVAPQRLHPLSTRLVRERLWTGYYVVEAL